MAVVLAVGLSVPPSPTLASERPVIVVLGELEPDRAALEALGASRGHAVLVTSRAGAATAGEDPVEAEQARLRRRAREAAARIRTLYYEARVDEAASEARARLAEWAEPLAYAGAFAELGDLWMWLAISQAKLAQGSPEARRAVARALDLGRPLPEPGILAPEVMAVLVEGRKEAEARPRRILRIQTSPLGAEVAIDGRVVGKAPLERLLPSGEHYVSLERFGWQPAVRRVLVEASAVPTAATAGPLTLEVALEPGTAANLGRQVAHRRSANRFDLDDAELVAAVARLNGAQQVVTVRRPPSPPSSGAPPAAVERLRLERWTSAPGSPWRRTSAVEIALAGEPSARAAAIAVGAAALWPTVAARESAPAPGSPPVWKRWWFWTALGVVAAGAAAGAAVGATRSPSGYKITCCQ